MLRTQKTIKVVICNQYALFRDGIKALFEHQGPIKIVAEAATGQEAIDHVERLKPDVVLLDVELPDLSGFATMHRMLEIDPDVKVLILTLSKNHRTQIARCLESGAAGHIKRHDRRAELEALIPVVASRRRTLTTGRKSALPAGSLLAARRLTA